MSFLKDENGQGLIEYALILGFIAIVAVVALVLFGPKIRSNYNKSSEGLDGATVRAD